MMMMMMIAMMSGYGDDDDDDDHKNNGSKATSTSAEGSLELWPSQSHDIAGCLIVGGTPKCHELLLETKVLILF